MTNLNKVKSAYILEATFKQINRKPHIALLCNAKNKFKMYQEFYPYFYILPGKNPEDLKKDLLDLTDAGRGVVKGVEETERILFGEKIQLLKVTCTNPRVIPKLQSYLSEIKCFEYKIPYNVRYLIDNNIAPLSVITYEKEGRFIKKLVKSKEKDLKKLNIVCFDIEVYADKSIPDYGEEPIIMISLANSNGDSKVLTYRNVKNKKAVILENEEEMISQFFKEIRDADILTGYNTSAFDIPYIIKRCQKLGIEPKFVAGVPVVKKRGRTSQAKVPGVVHIDLFSLILFFSRLGAVSVSRYTLDQVYKDMFSIVETTKNIMEDKNFAASWDNASLREKLFEYSLGDAEMTYKIFERVYPLLIELAKVSKSTMFDISVDSSSRLIERLLMYESVKSNEVIPPIPSGSTIGERIRNPIEGAYVKLPEPGIYENIIVFDFRSLYPTIIVSHNIDPSTVNKTCKDFHESPMGHKFCKEPKGLIPTVLEELLKTRFKLKNKLNKLSEGTEEYKRMYSRVQALKILANSFYGYLGYSRSRWYSRECAESVTAWARHYIKWTMEEAEKQGFTVLYGDTDSTMLLLGEKKFSDAKNFMKSINSKLPGMMELELEKFYPRGIFVSKKSEAKGAKKKYALIDKEGRIKIRGFELVRRDWAPISKQTQKEVLTIILNEGDKSKAIKLVQKVIEKLKKGEVPIEQTAIRTVIRKRLDSYEILSPEVAAAHHAIEQGESINSGSMIEYVITKGQGKISEKARTLKYAKNYDPDYYIKKQILPSVLKILEELGVDEDELLGKGRQEALGNFF